MYCFVNLSFSFVKFLILFLVSCRCFRNMSIYSFHPSSSYLRTGMNWNSGFSDRRRHRWLFSQIHSRTIFLLVQILMIILALIVFCSIPYFQSLIDDQLPFVLLFAYTNFFGAIAGLFALKLSDTIHQNGCRVAEYCAIPPHLLVIPSFIIQIGNTVIFLYLTYWYLEKCFHMYGNYRLLFLIFALVFPLLSILSTILYIFAVEIDCFLYIAHRSRYWRFPKNPATLLNIQSVFNDRYTLDSPLRKDHRCANASEEHERTKSSASVGTQNSGSKKSCNGAEVKVEMMQATQASDEMTFSELMNSSRRGFSLCSQLDTVPEESSKSTGSYQ